MTKDEIVKSLLACGRGCCDDCVCFKEKILCKVKNLEAADLIEQQAAKIAELEAKAPRWIPVTERLPEIDGRYLVCRCDYVTSTIFSDILLFESGIWWNGHHGGDYAVTHWMPLPEAPKEGEKT